MPGDKDAGSDAADAQIEGLDKAIDLQREIQAQNRVDLGPQRFYGATALRQLAGGEMNLPDLGPYQYNNNTGAVSIWTPPPAAGVYGPGTAEPAIPGGISDAGGMRALARGGYDSFRSNLSSAGWYQKPDGQWSSRNNDTLVSDDWLRQFAAANSGMASSPAPANTLASLQGGGPTINMTQQANGTYAMPAAQAPAEAPMQLGSGSLMSQQMAMEQAGWRNLGRNPEGVVSWQSPEGRVFNEDMAIHMAGQQGVRPVGSQGVAPAPVAAVPTSGLAAQTQVPPPYGQAPQGEIESGFEASPGYQFRLDEGLKAVQRSAANRGMLNSGQAWKALNNYAQGQASSEYGNYYNRLAGIAGVGQASTNTLAGLNTQTGTEIGNLFQQQGNARASGYIQDANSKNQMFGNLLSLGTFAASPFGLNAFGLKSPLG